MVTAEITITREQLVSISQPMQYVGLNWDAYKAISEELGESRTVHLTYEKGILTVMPISVMHELMIRFFEQFMAVVGLTQRINITPTGSATMRSKMKQIGVEPDLSYFIGRSVEHPIKNYVPDEMDLPPDIVVEIDIKHSSDDKFSIYAALGISEFWRYDGETMKMYLLAEDGRYEPIEQSRQLEILTPEILTEFLGRGQKEGVEQFELLSDFQERLQANK
ncbi:MAG: Uma2 family endonuclease [Pyrinomonadaceae bacterium]